MLLESWTVWFQVHVTRSTAVVQNSSFTNRAFKCFRWCWRSNFRYFSELEHLNFLCILYEFRLYLIRIPLVNDSKILKSFILQGLIKDFSLWFFWWIGWNKIDIWTLRRFPSFLILIFCIKRVHDFHISQFSRIYVSNHIFSLTKAWVINNKQQLFP